jgi:hypothetical protein
MGTYLTKGSTFTTGDTVTAANLNNLVDNATVTAGSIGSTELGTNAVTADKISTSAPQPVTTGTIRDNAVDNTKLNNMGSQTVKVNATNSSADPSDLAMIGGSTNGSSKILMGTSNSINALTASQFKMVDGSDADATNNTATKLRLHTTAISDWATVAAATDVHDDNDRLLIYDADGVSASVASLKQVSPKKLVQSMPATTGTTGVVKIATGTELTNPFASSHYTELALSPKEAVNSPLFAKAWANISTTLAHGAATGNTSLDSSFNFGTEVTSGTLTSAKKYKIIEYKSGDDFTNIGGTNVTGNQFTTTGTTPTTWTNGSRLVLVPEVTSQGVIPFVFSTAMPSTNYFVTGEGNYGDGSTVSQGLRIETTSVTPTTSGFTVKCYAAQSTAVATPMLLRIVVFGT